MTDQTNTVSVISTKLTTSAAELAVMLGINSDTNLITKLKTAAFKGQEASDIQMVALINTAQRYKLNPWTGEIHAVLIKDDGIISVVSANGWLRIINAHPQLDGIEFEQNNQSCTCTIYRKDHGHPTRLTEWFSDCKRNTKSWQLRPLRMLRYKALIECAKLAFGFLDIYDQDEAQRIAEAEALKKAKEAAIHNLEEPIVNYYLSQTEARSIQITELDKKVAILEQFPDLQFRIYGHTCPIGTREVNQRVGMARAENAKKYLISKGVAESRILGIDTKRDTEPIVPNDTEANRRINRRVQLIVEK
jgi:outer membrane protein OmpA-like peptidoglycan-associated protein